MLVSVIIISWNMSETNITDNAEWYSRSKPSIHFVGPGMPSRVNDPLKGGDIKRAVSPLWNHHCRALMYPEF